MCTNRDFWCPIQEPVHILIHSSILAIFHIEVWLFKLLRCGGWIWPPWQGWDGPRHVILYTNLADDCRSNPKTTSLFWEADEKWEIEPRCTAQACTWDLRYHQGKSEQKYRVAPHSFPWASGRICWKCWRMSKLPTLSLTKRRPSNTNQRLHQAWPC